MPTFNQALRNKPDWYIRLDGAGNRINVSMGNTWKYNAPEAVAPLSREEALVLGHAMINLALEMESDSPRVG